MRARFAAALAVLTAGLVLALGTGFALVRTPNWQSRGLIAMVPAPADKAEVASVVGSFNASGAIGTYVELAGSADTKRLAAVPPTVSVASRAIPDSRVIDVRTEGTRADARPALARVLRATVARQSRLNDAWRLEILQSAQPATVAGPSTTSLIIATVLLALLAAVFVWVALRRFLPTLLPPPRRSRERAQDVTAPESSHRLEEAAVDRT